MRKPTLGIVNRFPASRPYILGEHFIKLGVDVHLMEFSQFAFEHHDDYFKVLYDDKPVKPKTLLWRLSENMFPAAEVLAEQLTREGKRLFNPLTALNICADKLSTQKVLKKAHIPHVPAVPTLPGSPIRTGMIGKPSRGAGGRSIIFNTDSSDNIVVPPESQEPWIVQPFVGEGKDFIRVLVVGQQALCAYRRIPSDNVRVNNVDSGGSRVFVEMTEELATLAVNASNACGTAVAGVDISPEPYRILEVNGNPGLPPEYVHKTAEALYPILFT